MGKVSKNTIEKLNAFIDSLPEEARSKCSLCNETLTHIVKMAEAKTGAGTRTVTRVLSEKINEDAAPGDRVSNRQLRGRVERQDPIGPKRANNLLTKKQETEPSSWALDFAAAAISQLKRIEKNDPMRTEALNRVKVWVNQQLNY